MDHTLDHIGPITRTVADNAMMLEVMAGPTGATRSGSAPTRCRACIRPRRGAAPRKLPCDPSVAIDRPEEL
jgi:amidase